MAKLFGLGKKERLKSRKLIDDLFATGKGLNVFPLRIAYKFFQPSGMEVLQAGVTVSKKHFKKAVDRNKIKRLLREAYRMQKNELRKLLELKDQSAVVFIIYAHKELPTFEEVYNAMRSGLLKIQKALVNEGNS